MKNKYNVFCEVKIVNIILIILGIGLCIISLFVDKKLDHSSLIITLLLVAMFVKNLKKYLNLKKYGKLLKNVKFKITNRNEITLYVNNKTIKGNLTFKTKVKEGLTDVIINKNDPNEFFAFGPIN